jgi:hypothetical protein
VSAPDQAIDDVRPDEPAAPSYCDAHASTLTRRTATDAGGIGYTLASAP